jgi:diamine N-acetyltransferase
VSAVALREVTDENRHAVLAVRVAPAQKRFVGTVAAAVVDAQEIPEGKPWYRAIYASDQPVGFVMLSWNVTPEPPRIIGPWFLWKLLIDERYQRRGYGREAVRLVADIVRANGASELLTSCVPGDDGPEPFYRHIGFRPTGELDENGEIILALDLHSKSQSKSR